MSSSIMGKWKVEAGQFAGLTYTFKSDGTFEMDMSIYGVKGCGTYKTYENLNPREIDINFTEHTSGLPGLGLYKGIFEFENDKLKMKFGTANGERWTDTSAYINYVKGIK